MLNSNSSGDTPVSNSIFALQHLTGVIKLLAGALALCADASHQLDKSRRRAFQPAIHEDFKALCTDNYPVEGLLFSRDLGDKIKNLGNTNCISKSLGKNTSTQVRPKRSFPFLGRGRPRQYDWSSREGQNYPAHRNQESFQPYQSRGRGRRQQQWPSPIYTKGQGKN
ncbi:hypothetical protein RRG08_015495 [Elysia crispata]|uniref:Uncharacterized protein n=1 Tax=Elysia crispata TaxID=231223 RepID=A0AAE1DX56_9GAST|nr:hypothetical protein RRG08_015495 [Elysia crispata]